MTLTFIVRSNSKRALLTWVHECIVNAFVSKKKDKITTLYSPQSITFSDQKSFKFPLSCNTSVDFSRRLGLAIPHQTFYQSDFVHRNVKHIDIDFPWKQSHWTRKKSRLYIYRRPSRALRRGKMNESPDMDIWTHCMIWNHFSIQWKKTETIF